MSTAAPRETHELSHAIARRVGSEQVATAVLEQNARVGDVMEREVLDGDFDHVQDRVDGHDAKLVQLGDVAQRLRRSAASSASITHALASEAHLDPVLAREVAELFLELCDQLHYVARPRTTTRMPGTMSGMYGWSVAARRA